MSALVFVIITSGVIALIIVSLIVLLTILDNKSTDRRLANARQKMFSQDSQEVSLPMLLAYPQKYLNKKVTIIEDLIIVNNDIVRKNFLIAQYKVDKNGVIQFSHSITVNYSDLPEIDKYIMLDVGYENYPKIKLTGIAIGTSVMSSTFSHIIATEIIFL